jgi:hypothetical protein
MKTTHRTAPRIRCFFHFNIEDQITREGFGSSIDWNCRFFEIVDPEFIFNEIGIRYDYHFQILIFGENYK